MSFFWDGLQQAWSMIWDRDPYLMGLLEVTLKVAGVSTAVALLIGLPIGLVLALGRFPGRNVGIVLANAGLGLPPVVVGLILALLFFPAAPLGFLELSFTLNGVYVAQSVLCLPIVVALTVSAVREISPGLLDQARAFGARRHRLAVLAVREARVGILAATIASVGAGLSEVGAVVLVGGNVVGASQTLASASLSATDAGAYSTGLAIGIILLGLIVVITAALTWLQYGRVRYQRGWAAS